MAAGENTKFLFYMGKENDGTDHHRPRGTFIWTNEGYNLLKERYPRSERVVGDFPESGLILSHVDNIPKGLPLKKDRYIVGFRADRRPSSNCLSELVQNHSQLPGQRGIRAHFLLHPPQPGIKHRNPKRKGIRDLAFMGNAENLHPALKSEAFNRTLERLGMRLHLHLDRVSWQDYSDRDAVLAIRSFGDNPHANKPATKLYNTWLGGCIPILGTESEFRRLRKDEHDYIEAASLEALEASLERLSRDQDYVERLLRQSELRASEFTHEAMSGHWADVIAGEVFQHATRWFNSPVHRARRMISLRYFQLLKNVRTHGMRGAVVHYKNQTSEVSSA